MNVAPITNTAGLQYVTITRSGGLTGVAQQVRIDRADLGAATVAALDGTQHRVALDASQSEDVLHALSGMIAAPGELKAGRPDAYDYDIELTFDGETRHFHTNGLAADEALHGAIDLTDTALNHHTELRSMPVKMPVGVGGAVAPNGNGGIVPTWLMDGNA
jgi:hypothetical protein